MNRREVLAAGAALATGVAAADTPDAHLGATRYIDIDHPDIRARARAITAEGGDDKQRAQAIFAFVRDAVPFGFSSGFWDQRASQVLKSGRGFCNTKSTLFVALLRAAGIPARQVFVDIDVAVLGGVIDPGTPYVDHSYVEVFLDGAWRATDAYIVDRALFGVARKRVIESGRVLGWGVHATGSCEWNGVDASFAQYNLNDPRPLGTKRWGVHADVGAFYRDAGRPWNRLNPVLRAGMGVLAARSNATLDAMRGRG